MSAQDQISDEVLISRIGKGDKSAMKSLYDRLSKPLYCFLRARMGDPFEAADLMQETFLEVWRGAARFEGRSSARTWIFGIARNRSVDRLRRAGRVVLAEPDETVADETPDPEALAAAASDASKVRACMEGLSAPHRSVVELAFFQDLGYGEIAEIEGVPTGTVKTRIMHAKQLLKRCLAAFMKYR
ncbi:sigma-70 family RNA polymerase sigma factor [Paracoccus sp. MBLB3053]|uniref:Sigma-70 family RNA polymerase sigma factor n=1 Tax=Paracoccus aurantius TaxID=3073814 RepID=A0ABU2HY29_9RHOB|nr:sigma-70 family RNA polymerase sigma factor [Paracoccus sp. MBLB3053]MDS9469963.1 sigma-70 family RNA polymerase sigma factor [Paracoccus sp. MBLB3053]